MTFAGDKKFGASILAKPEAKLRDMLLPLVPQCVQTYHLTLTTVLWSLLIIVFCFLASFNPRWMWWTSLMIVLQYITDLLDGAVGRTRNTGLVKWGFYMDHFLDYLFLCAMLVGYGFLLADHSKYLVFFVLALFGAFMVNSFLSFAATNQFRIAYMGFGPTEMRLVFIGFNMLIAVLGVEWLARVLRWLLPFATFSLFVTVFQTQKMLWAVDMAKKAEEEERSCDE